jgi:transposase
VVAAYRCPLARLPERYGPWRTVASRFYRWRKAGIWDRLLAAVQQQADANGRLNWDVHYVDGTIVRAHQHAAGAKKGLQTPKRSGAAKAASVRKSTYAPTATASSCRLSSRQASGMRPLCVPP